ncbi:MAG TPA: DsbA family protein [Solirubrobacteraceae bacterium]|nr:DsbA family protein [Solirubrobacteraceae bacterium]
MAIETTHFTDPGCPWAYSASPALAALGWRYGDQLDWRLVTIGLTEDARQYIDRGYTPLRQLHGYIMFRDRFGMPFSTVPRPRISATARACRAIVATRLRTPALEHDVFRALQFGNFTDSVVFDDDDDLRRTLRPVEGLDADAIVDALDSPEVTAAYERDRAEARTAAGSPTEFQGKTAATDGAVRYTAPSLIFERPDGRRLEAGGFQTLEAYDVILANLDPTLERTPPPADPLPVLERFPGGLTTQEVAAVMAPPLTDPDRTAAEQALVELVCAGAITGTPLGDDALWRVSGDPVEAGALAAGARAAVS